MLYREQEEYQATRWGLIMFLVALPVLYLMLVYGDLLLHSRPGKFLLGNDVLPKYLKGKTHNDYKIPSLRWFPRSWTSLGLEESPILILGNGGNKPLCRPGTWQLSAAHRPGSPLYLYYFAMTTSSGMHIRIGARWDIYDHYYTFPTAVAKRIKSWD